MNEKRPENLYEVLQLSPSAEQLVITKVYRLLAAYYHPDNKQTGDEERFKLVLKAYEVLSDPAKRSRYDLETLGKSSQTTHRAGVADSAQTAARSKEELKAKFGFGDDGNGTSGDSNISERELRKLLLMALYDVRRNTPNKPELSLLVLSELLGCTVEDLEFSNWYLKEKGYIKISESADFSVTIAGVDYVETELLKKSEQTHQVLSLPEGRS